MKIHWMAALGVVVAAGIMYACTSSSSSSVSPASARVNAQDAGRKERLSYGVGYSLGEEVRTGLEIDAVDADMELLVQGFADALERTEPALARDKLDEVLYEVHEEMQKRMVARLLADDPAFRALHDRNLAESEAFHQRYGREAGVVTLPSGAQYRELRAGSGRSPSLDDTVLVTFSATKLDGTEYNAGERVEVAISTVMPGARELVTKMQVGDRWEFAVPPKIGYGAGGNPPLVGPNETVRADVELLGIVDGGAP